MVFALVVNARRHASQFVQLERAKRSSTRPGELDCYGHAACKTASAKRSVTSRRGKRLLLRIVPGMANIGHGFQLLDNPVANVQITLRVRDFNPGGGQMFVDEVV